MTCPDLLLSRRAMLGGMGAAVTLGRTSLSFAAAPTNARLVVVNLRGGLDGLSTVIPYGDPALAGLRAALVPPGMIKLGSFFAVDPSLSNFAAMVAAGEASAVHAVGPTVATRSHFQAQDYMQSGTGALLTTGWLNRALAAAGASSGGIALCAQPPLLMRGALPLGGIAPDCYKQMPPALLATLPALTAADPAIGPADVNALADRTLYDQILGSTANPNVGSLAGAASVAGRLLAASNGPRVASLEVTGIDTHDSQLTRLQPVLGQVDAALASLKSALGAAWANTVVMTMTEFGRTAYVNGTNGTDHGTGFAILLAGGAVAGGKVIATWPGLGQQQLFQGRDLAPTVDFRSVAMGILAGHMSVPLSAQQAIFPGSVGIAPLAGLTRG